MKNYIHCTFGLTLLVALLAIALRYIPAETTQRLGIKSADILSSLKEVDDAAELDQLAGEAGTEMLLPTDSSTVNDGAALEIELQASGVTTAAVPAATSITASQITTAQTQAAALADQPAARPGVIPIEDYSPGHSMLTGFRAQLTGLSGNRKTVRIGFLGDSFIEGDLLTCDLREQLQNTYGGGGVGFVPITSQVAGFRQTVGHKFGNWNQRSIIANASGGFTLSGFSYTPTEGAFVEYKGSTSRKHLSRFDRARLIFINRRNSVIRATANGEEEFVFNTEPSEVLQELLLEGDIRTIRYSVSQVEGFTAYGAFLENSHGICVDNFSVRGNAGTVMARINPTLTQQFGKLSPYHLIVLEYGLNVVSSNVTNYSTYRQQMVTVVNHFKQCFPQAAILLVGVGDRLTRMDGQFVTMPGIRAMVRTQQQVAQECGILFWNTYEMMRAVGGMNTFVKNGWAAKDYTHIGASGGKKIANALYEALIP